MRGDPIPPRDFVARHCRFTDLIWHNGQPIAVTESAFRPRPDENDGLSVIWVDYFQGNNRTYKVRCVRSVTKLHAKDSHRIALLQVQDLVQAASPVANLTVQEDPDEGLPPQFNAAHSLIRPVGEFGDIGLRHRLASRVKPADLHPYR
jgi:hypothetical protein